MKIKWIDLTSSVINPLLPYRTAHTKNPVFERVWPGVWVQGKTITCWYNTTVISFFFGFCVKSKTPTKKKVEFATRFGVQREEQNKVAAKSVNNNIYVLFIIIMLLCHLRRPFPVSIFPAFSLCLHEGPFTQFFLENIIFNHFDPSSLLRYMQYDSSDFVVGFSSRLCTHTHTHTVCYIAFFVLLALAF